MLDFILDYKKLFFIFLILFILIILIFKDKIFKDKIFNKNNINLFNRKKEVTFDEDKNKTLEIPKKFIESNTFQGKKENYVFKKGSLGIKYYFLNIIFN